MVEPIRPMTLVLTASAGYCSSIGRCFNAAAWKTTSGRRVAKMRFEFELGDPSHLDAILSTLRQIDSVYDAYRSGTRE